MEFDFDNINFKKITKILNFILFFVIVYICYKFYYDVLYRMQIQIPYFSKTYFWTSSREFCLFLVTLYLLCIILMRWWFSLMVLLPLLPLPIYILYWLKIRYNYTQGFINGMIWHKELFNYNINIYLYKTLEEWQKSWVVWKEITQRKNATSFLVYRECRDFSKDEYIQKFFDDFHLDYSDSESFERIRSQIDIYQRAKIKLANWQLDEQMFEYIAENPIKWYSLCIYDYIIEYPERIIVYSVAGMLAGVLLYYHLIENPFYYRIFGRPAVEAFSGSEIEFDKTELYDYFIQSIGKITPGTSPDVIYYNLTQIITDNVELIAPLTKSLMFSDFSINKEVLDQIIPKVYNSQFVCIKIIEYLEKNFDKMNSPFEQFEVNVLQRISFFGLDFSFSNLTLYLVLAIIVILILSYLITKSLSLIPNYWQSVIEIFYSFIFSMLIDQAGKKAKVFFPAIFSLFFFILVSNLLGLIPLSFAVTSHVVITFCLGFGFFVAWIIVAFKTIGMKIFNIFWPTNVPLWLRPLLMVVEILSFTLRPLSLSIRLFVNILAGHILLHLVSGSVVLVFSKAMIFSFIPFVLLLAVFCLELGIAFLQAYIFSILLCIYLHDSYHVHGH
jgi:F-type H+-transporting ATPase subunit a